MRPAPHWVSPAAAAAVRAPLVAAVRTGGTPPPRVTPATPAGRGQRWVSAGRPILYKPNQRPRTGSRCGEAPADTTPPPPAGATAMGGAAAAAPGPLHQPPSLRPCPSSQRSAAAPVHGEARARTRGDRDVQARHGRANVSTVGAPPSHPPSPSCGGGDGGGVIGDISGTAISAATSSQYHCSSSFQ